MLRNRLTSCSASGCHVFDYKVALVRDVVDVRISTNCIVQCPPAPMEGFSHPPLDRRAEAVPLRESVGVHIDEAIIRLSARTFCVSDQTLALARTIHPQGRRNIEVHLVGIVKG